MNDTYSINMQKKEVNPGFTNVKHPNLKIQNEFLTKVKKKKKKFERQAKALVGTFLISFSIYSEK